MRRLTRPGKVVKTTPDIVHAVTVYRGKIRLAIRKRWLFFALMLPLMLASCGAPPWNNPYPAGASSDNTLYKDFQERPKHLDPVRSYVSNEYEIIGQIYEPPLQYHYLKRPYELVPLTATRVPIVKYFDIYGHRLPDTAPPEQIAYSDYIINITPGILYQPHPAFVQDENGDYLYHSLTPEALENISSLRDFPKTATRELVAQDYVNQIKRLAHPRLHSPIYGLMSEYIVGLKQYAATLMSAYKKQKTEEAHEGVFLDLSRYPLEGAQVIDRYSYRIRIQGKYPQLRYWLAMPFFAPVPGEAERFYAQPGLIAKNITLDWYPIGTGPYMLTENNPNQRMVMERNPNFHDERYPSEGEAGDREAGLLQDAGKKLPFIDKVIYSLEKESIPLWNKFLQGYYDTSGISSDTFDQAIALSGRGEPTLTDDMQAKGMRLQTAVATSIYYTGFNMLDPIVGGDTPRAMKLRQAISIAVDFEEYISIFLNGRAIPAHGPIPPGIFGHIEGRAGINPYVYDWVGGKPKRKSIEYARRLMKEAGYPRGRHARTGEPLLLHFDTSLRGPDAKASLDWLRKQFRKLNIQLVIRSTDWNRFLDKMRNGSVQIFQAGWNADYPDPENFMFLLYGPNKMVGKAGENGANYDSPAFNALYEKMKNMDSGPQRQALINQMTDIARRDSPWLWGFLPKAFGLHHQWYSNTKPNLMANNTLKYKRLDPELRTKMRKQWNQPILWPLYLLLTILALTILPAVFAYIRREHHMSAVNNTSS